MLEACKTVADLMVAAVDGGTAGSVVNCGCWSHFQVYYCSLPGLDSRAVEENGHWTPYWRDSQMSLFHFQLLRRSVLAMCTLAP
jgi:hypothetical protein